MKAEDKNLKNIYLRAEGETIIAIVRMYVILKLVV